MGFASGGGLTISADCRDEGGVAFAGCEPGGIAFQGIGEGNQAFATRLVRAAGPMADGALADAHHTGEVSGGELQRFHAQSDAIRKFHGSGC
ncbi:hypothetical protein D9M70_571500 [compost metagenome]